MPFDNGLVDGDPWTALALDNTEAAINVGSVPVGSIQAYIGLTAPSGWVQLIGQTITNAQTLNADLWAIAPVAWRSGANLVLPNAQNGIMLGQSLGSPGTLVGSNTVTLVTANLPSHDHSINHDHGAVTSGVESATHTHGFSGTTSGQSVDHSHGSGLGNYITRTSGGAFTFATGGSDAIFDRATSGGASNDHSHTYSGTTGGQSVNHTHSVDLPNFTGTSGATGSATAVSTVQSGLVITWILKVV